MDRMENGLDALWARYRDSCPDPEPTAQFMPGLWGRIDARRAASDSIFRRLAQICVMATVALTLLMAVVLIPRLQDVLVYTATYVDVLVADNGGDYTEVLAMGDIR
jgi:hypothetical protein